MESRRCREDAERWNVFADEFGDRAVLCSGWRRLVSPACYGELYAALDGVGRTLCWNQGVRQSIVVTATGTPLPQAQLSASITNLSKTDFINRADMVDVMRQVAGMNVVQTGQRGG